MRLGRWQQVLLDALAEQPAIGVRATVETHLGRPPSRAELMAARRAANRLGDLARFVHLEGVASSGGRLVLTRPGAQVDRHALKRAAEGRPPAPLAIGTNGTGTAKSALRWAQRAADAARQVDPDRISLDQADAISTELDDAVEHLVQLSRQLRARASSEAWMKPTDRLWLQR